MNVYLRHAIYGAKVAVSSKEVSHDKANGWEEYRPCEREASKVETSVLEKTEDLGEEPEVPSFMKESSKPGNLGEEPEVPSFMKESSKPGKAIRK